MSEEKVFSAGRIQRATGWSFAGEIMAKLITPITNMILARLLAPEIFGIVATVNMVVSLSEIFTEAGFQLYLIQHEFADEDELHRYASSAFWVSVLLGLLMLAGIAAWRDPLAQLVGSPGYGNALMVAAIAIPVTAAISILSALYRRKLDYKPLFVRRVLALIVPLVVTVPLALLDFGVWSLIIGTLAGRVVNLLALLVDRNYHPQFLCRPGHIVKMAPFCMTTLVSYLLTWATNWIDIFIIGHILGAYYTGLYKNSQSTVIGILATFTAALTPVLFSVLCRYADDRQRFAETMCSFTERISLLLLPIGFGVLICRRLVTAVLLGSAWMEAADFLGIWGLSTCFSAVYASYPREACRAVGKPYLNVVAQTLSLCVIIPASYYGALAGFDTMIYVRSAAALTLIFAYAPLLAAFLKLNPLKLFSTTLPALVASMGMAAVLLVLQRLVAALWFEAVLVAVGAVCYVAILCLFPKMRKRLLGALSQILCRVRRRAK